MATPADAAAAAAAQQQQGGGGSDWRAALKVPPKDTRIRTAVSPNSVLFVAAVGWLWGRQ